MCRCTSYQHWIVALWYKGVLSRKYILHSLFLIPIFSSQDFSSEPERVKTKEFLSYKMCSVEETMRVSVTTGIQHSLFPKTVFHSLIFHWKLQISWDCIWPPFRQQKYLSSARTELDVIDYIMYNQQLFHAIT